MTFTEVSEQAANEPGVMNRSGRSGHGTVEAPHGDGVLPGRSGS